MIKKGKDGKVIGINKVQTDDCVKHRDGVGTILTREQIEFFKLCREFNNEFYKGSIKTVVIPYENGDIKLYRGPTLSKSPSCGFWAGQSGGYVG
jgi:hypothetical protein